MLDNKPYHKDSIMSASIHIKEEKIYEEASKMSDKGYGSFERCAQILMACKGNLQEAEKILSKLMIKENK